MQRFRFGLITLCVSCVAGTAVLAEDNAPSVSMEAILPPSHEEFMLNEQDAKAAGETLKREEKAVEGVAASAAEALAAPLQKEPVEEVAPEAEAPRVLEESPKLDVEKKASRKVKKKAAAAKKKPAEDMTPVQLDSQSPSTAPSVSEVTPGVNPEEALRMTMSKAYMNNPGLESQRRSFQATVEQVPQALAGALPQVNAGYQKGRQRTQSSGTNGWTSSNSEAKSLSVTQPLFRGGTTYANVKSARRQVDAAEFRLQQVEEDVLLRAITAYMDVARASAVLDLSKKNRDVLTQQLDAASQRFEVGEDTKTDVAQSEARLAQAQSDFINNRGRLESQKAIYREIVGEPAGNFVLPEVMPETPKSLDELIDKALQNNPKIKETEQLKDSADYLIDANIGTLLPSVDLQGSMSRQEGIGIFGNTDFDQDEVVVAASLPIFQGGQRYSRVRAAKENYQQRRFQMLDMVNEVRRQAISAWEDLLASSSSIESGEQAVKAAEVALDGVRQEQQYGARTTLDVLDAERELFDANVRLVIAKRDRAVAAYSVLAVTGDLTAKNMGLDVTLYDPEDYYGDKEYQFIGF